MKYITQTIDGNTTDIYSTAELLRVGETVPSYPRWRVMGQYVTDFFNERLNDLIDEELYDFQTENDIDDGGLPPELEADLINRIEALKDSIAECKAWQLANNK